MFGLFKEKPGGLMQYHNLWDWWLDTFSDDERKTIEAIFQPLGSSGEELTKGKVEYSSGSATSLLSSLAGWFKNKKHRTIAYRILEKAEEVSKNTEVLDKHFLYQNKIEIYYRFRELDNFALSTAVEACEQQVNISEAAARAFRTEYPGEVLPMHVGYEQLAIILDKKKEFEKSISVCQKALEQGWGGNWQKRIEKYSKKK